MRVAELTRLVGLKGVVVEGFVSESAEEVHLAVRPACWTDRSGLDALVGRARAVADPDEEVTAVVDPTGFAWTLRTAELPQGAAAGALDAQATSPAPANSLLAGLVTSRPRAGKLSFSRARIEVPMSRPPVPHLIKMLLPVVCVVLCASMMFLFRPAYVDSRVELGITSLLTVVALQMTLGQELPDVAYLVLVDKVYVATYLYVMAAIGVVVKTTHLNDDGDAAGALRVNRLGMLTATVTYFSALGLLIIPRLV